jgi:dipeptidyl aminopeptidase/acylaminoacyl peptidase
LLAVATKDRDRETSGLVQLTSPVTGKVSASSRYGRFMPCAIASKDFVLFESTDTSDPSRGRALEGSAKWTVIGARPGSQSRDLPKGSLSTCDRTSVIPGSNDIVYLTKSGLSRVNLDTGKNTPIKLAGQTEVTQLMAIRRDPRDHSIEYLLRTHGDTDRIVRCKGQEGTMSCSSTNVNPAGATILAVGSGSLLTLTHSSGGTTVALYTQSGESATLMLNKHLDEVANPAYQTLTYKDSDGRNRRSTVLLPLGYIAGKKYATVAWVYSGQSAGPGSATAKDSDLFVNLNLLSARGYAVLIPDMNTFAGDQPADLMLELPKAVLPAVNSAIEKGIADPNRLAVLGHSYGAFSVYGLVAQTNIFKAAVAISGPSDMLMFYTHMHHLSRYQDSPLMPMHSMGELESGKQTGFKATPWQDMSRYVNNSPLSRGGNIQTPLLIMHGDLDGFDLIQAESMFAGLYRLNKKARLVRYWGEGHLFESSANVRDVWKQIDDWFREYL